MEREKKINFIGEHTECLSKNQLRELCRGAHSAHGATKRGWIGVCATWSSGCANPWHLSAFLHGAAMLREALSWAGVGEVPEEGIALKLFPSHSLEWPDFLLGSVGKWRGAAFVSQFCFVVGAEQSISECLHQQTLLHTKHICKVIILCSFAARQGMGEGKIKGRRSVEEEARLATSVTSVTCSCCCLHSLHHFFCFLI